MKEINFSMPFCSFSTYWERIKNSPLAYRFSRGTFWVLIGAASSRFLSMVSAILVVRMLGKEKYGEFGIIDSTVAMFTILGSFGLGMTGIKFLAELRVRDRMKAGRIIALSKMVASATGTLMTVALVLSSGWIAEHVLKAPHLASLLRIGAIIIFFESLIDAQSGVLSGLEAFKAIAQRNIILGVTTFPLMLGGVYLGGVTGAVWALLSSTCIKWLLNHHAVKKETAKFGIPLSYSGFHKEFKILWSFSLPAVLGGLIVGPVNWACLTMLARQANGYGEMGVFNAANQWFNAISFLPGLIAQVVLPILAERHGDRDHLQSKRILALSLKVNAAIVLPMVVVGSLASHHIMLIYGHGFAHGWLTLIFALMTAGTIAMITPIGLVITASGAMWTHLYMNLGWAVIYLVATKLAVSHGSTGLAFAKLFAYGVYSIGISAIAYRYMKK